MCARRLLFFCFPLLLASTATAQNTIPPLPELMNMPHADGLWHYQYNAIWNESLPYYKDPRQARMYNCWLPAASIAVTWVNPDWVARLLFHSDNSSAHGQWFPTAETATVQLWDPAYDDGTRHNFSVSLYQKSLTEDYPNGNWWHSALTQGFSQMGMLPIPEWVSEKNYRVYGIHNNNGSFWHNNGIPAVAMAMLTGKPVKVATKSEIQGGINEWWGYIKHAQESPVVVTTVGVNNTVKSDPEIHGNHAYAVLMTSEEPIGNRTVLMRNPWGTQDWYKAEDVWANSFYLNHLVNFTKLEWKN